MKILTFELAANLFTRLHLYTHGPGRRSLVAAGEIDHDTPCTFPANHVGAQRCLSALELCSRRFVAAPVHTIITINCRASVHTPGG